jgi:hypothetical protein
VEEMLSFVVSPSNASKQSSQHICGSFQDDRRIMISSPSSTLYLSSTAFLSGTFSSQVTSENLELLHLLKLLQKFAFISSKLMPVKLQIIWNANPDSSTF